MSITTHAELLTAISSWLASAGDVELAASDDDFVVLAEQRIHYGAGSPGDPLYSPPLRVLAMETSADLTVSAQAVDAPAATFLEARRLYLSGSPNLPLAYLPPMDFYARFLSTDTGPPVAFTIEGKTTTPYMQFVFGPSPGLSYTGKLLYVAKFAALVSGPNWLIANAPSVYLYGALLEAAIYIDETDDAARFSALYNAAITGLMRSDQRAKHTGAPLQMRSPGPTP